VGDFEEVRMCRLLLARDAGPLARYLMVKR